MRKWESRQVSVAKSAFRKRPVFFRFLREFQGARKGEIRAETTEAQRHGDGSNGLKMGRGARCASQVTGVQRVSFFGFANRPVLSRFVEQARRRPAAGRATRAESRGKRRTGLHRGPWHNRSGTVSLVSFGLAATDRHEFHELKQIGADSEICATSENICRRFLHGVIITRVFPTSVGWIL